MSLIRYLEQFFLDHTIFARATREPLTTIIFGSNTTVGVYSLRFGSGWCDIVTVESVRAFVEGATQVPRRITLGTPGHATVHRMVEFQRDGKTIMLLIDKSPVYDLDDD
jgi:hypothetical protein